MKQLNLTIHLLLLAMLPLAACGSSSGNQSLSSGQSSIVAKGSLASVTSSVAAALNVAMAPSSTAAALTTLDSGGGAELPHTEGLPPPNQAPSVGSSSGGSSEAAPPGGIGNVSENINLVSSETPFHKCQRIELPLGGFSVTCECQAFGKAGGTMTTTFDQSVSNVSSAKNLSSITVTSFDNCINSECGQVITLNGEFAGSVTADYDSTAHTAAFSYDSGTQDRCSGLQVQIGDAAVQSYGFEMSFTNGTGQKASFGGNVCSNGQTTTFTTIDEFKKLTQAQDQCEQTSCEKECVATCSNPTSSSTDNSGETTGSTGSGSVETTPPTIGVDSPNTAAPIFSIGEDVANGQGSYDYKIQVGQSSTSALTSQSVTSFNSVGSAPGNPSNGNSSCEEKCTLICKMNSSPTPVSIPSSSDTPSNNSPKSSNGGSSNGQTNP